MNKILIGIVIAILVIGGGAFLLSRSNSSQTQMHEQTMPTQAQAQTQTTPTSTMKTIGGQNAITIQNFAFSPATLTVKVGDKVTWTNQDSVGHSATADDGSFDTGVFGQGQSASTTFSKAGTYTYHCSVHPMMKGTIIVQ